MNPVFFFVTKRRSNLLKEQSKDSDSTKFTTIQQYLKDFF